MKSNVFFQTVSHRPTILQTFVVGLLVATAVGLTATIVGAADPPRPNLLVIITDQQQASMMSCAGEKHVKTPAMDRLAAIGVRFERAYAANPVCVPSRMSMFTGYFPSRFGMRSNAEHRNPAPREAIDGAMGWIFRRAGYDTVYGGKTHWMRGMTPQTTGFRELTLDQRGGLADACVQFLEKKHDKPFLLVASFINPHDICYMAIDDYTRAEGKPIMYPKSHVERQCLARAMQLPAGVARAQFFETYAPPLPGNFAIPKNEPECIGEQYVRIRGFQDFVRRNWSPERWRRHRWAYRRLTEMVDAHIGKLVDVLERTGLDKNTVTIFASDHGDMDGSHHLEHKSVLYEEAARVPLIIAGKGVERRGEADNTHLVSVGLDLIPTLCDFASIRPPEGLPGRSLKPLVLKNEPDKWPDQVVVESRAGRMLRTGRFKYVVYESGQNREVLIDLENDPGEMNNLAGDPKLADILNDHRRRLRQWVVRSNDRIAEPYVPEGE